MRQNAQQNTSDKNQLLFLPGVFNETLSLLFDAHHYFNTRGMEDQAVIEPSKRLFYASEMSRVTLRLTSVMAWIMVRRAVNAGRIDADKAEQDYRLGGGESCTVTHPEMMPAMPTYLNYLSERSLSLYERIQRLDNATYSIH